MKIDRVRRQAINFKLKECSRGRLVVSLEAQTLFHSAKACAQLLIHNLDRRGC